MDEAPLKRLDPVCPGTAAPGTRVSPVSRGRLLVVDDNEMNRDMLARRLVQRGFEVAVAAGGEEAIRLVHERRFDLLLLDVMMPGLSGLDVLTRLRKEYAAADLPVIMATARDTTEDIVEALRLGANDYVTKPLDFGVVLARVETHISLKRAKEEVQKLNDSLLAAEERISRLLDSSQEALHDLPAWARAASADMAGAIGAREIGVFSLEGETLTPLTGGPVSGPSALELSAVRKTRGYVYRGGVIVVPVFGLSGDLAGALVVRGKEGALAREETRLLESFAHQLGGALELRSTRIELAAEKERRLATRREMLEKGIAVLQVCPACGLCFDQNAAACSADGTVLESPRPLPFEVLGRYRLVRLLAEGGMGLVFHASDLRLGREVALKIVKPEHFDDPALRVRFEYEARAVARIDHPGVIALHDTGELEDGSIFLVMERLHGCDLAVVLKEYGRGTPAQVAFFLRQGSAAIAAAHRAGVIHRDIKPENIFLVDAPEGFRLKVLDFGLAKEVHLESRLTQKGLIVGTPAYMSPEQVASKEVDVRSDLYSFASVAYEALTGRRVTLEEELARIFIDVLQNEPPPPSVFVPGLPPEVDWAFSAALAKHPSARPVGIVEWASSCADLLEPVPSDIPGWPAARDGMTDSAVYRRHAPTRVARGS